MEVENNLFQIAKGDLRAAEILLSTANDEIMQNIAAYHVQQAVEKTIKQLIIEKRGMGTISHDIGMLVKDAKGEGIEIPSWVSEGAYEISRWATTIRYNSKFKTNRELIINYVEKTNQWIEEITCAHT